MDQGGTDEFPLLTDESEPTAPADQAARLADEDVQLDLFGMPVAGASANNGASGAVPGNGGDRANALINADARIPTVAHATSAIAHATAPTNRSRQPRTQSIASLWQDEAETEGALSSDPHEAERTPSPPAAPKQRRAREVAAAEPSPEVLAIAQALPPQVHLGTSSWSFPGWNGIVYADDYSNSKLSRDGLAAYGAHPLLRTVSIDRSFYAPLTVTDYLRYAQQVPDHFRFIVKAPAMVTDATVRAERGEPVSLNPCFLNAQLAIDEFVRPCLDGLGAKAGALVFQFSPLPDQMLADPAGFIERLALFLAALPPLLDGACYAVEIRDACLLTPRFIRTLKAAGVRYCVGIHARMPDPLRQAAALALLDGEPAGPLIVRWSLHGGFKYEQAKAKYEPFDRLVDEDPTTRMALAELAARYAIAGQPVVIAVNNKAEGSAPLTCAKLGQAIVEAYARLMEESESADAAAPT
ncbi:MAG: DUF72 domain-containing protein [Paraburkholderia sp.]|uniref:DUF72 domain-containing protein n=1 Tax=Paraburkholderia sp. TaxID=1926495 RepID=UPI003C61DFEE